MPEKKPGSGFREAAIYMVSAWAQRNQLVLGQQKVDDRSNEITAIPKLLTQLDIAGAVITMDALQGHRWTPIAGFWVMRFDEFNQSFPWSKAVHFVQKSFLLSGYFLMLISKVSEASCTHHSIVPGGRSSCVTLTEFTWVNTMIGNIKNAMTGACHSIYHQHLPRYLAEFCYRFNRRFQLEDMSPRFMYVALRIPLMPEKFLNGAWGR